MVSTWTELAKTTVNKALAETLNEALLDKDNSRETYQKVIDTFSGIRDRYYERG
jgi:shikimate kinase